MLMPAHWLRLIRMPILTKGSRNSLLRMLLITLLLPACSFLIFLSTISRSSFSTSYSTPRNLSRLFLASSSLAKCQRGLTHVDEVIMRPPAPLHQPVGRLRGDGGGKSEQKSRRELAVRDCSPGLAEVTHLLRRGQDSGLLKGENGQECFGWSLTTGQPPGPRNHSWSPYRRRPNSQKSRKF